MKQHFLAASVTLFRFLLRAYPSTEIILCVNFMQHLLPAKAQACLQSVPTLLWAWHTVAISKLGDGVKVTDLS